MINKLNPLKYRLYGLLSIGVFIFGIIYATAIFPAVFKFRLKMVRIIWFIDIHILRIIIIKLFTQVTQLKPGAEMRGYWEIIPFYLGFKLYLFNITNPDEVIHGGLPILDQIGPYFFE